ncbi:hypothetical protein [Novosphingobium colocasiae]|uniref:hypothetical protein n=1 Tax=Novosphingobium colocasiae TaxID=1256513 RepID=UPI0035AE28D3
MPVQLTEKATDWTGHTYDERLRLCLDTLFVHGLIKDRTYNHATAQLLARATIQREHRARLLRHKDSRP